MPSDKKYFGATPEEWNHFSLILGLDQDLLPAVADPTALISPPVYNEAGKQIGGSRMKAIGKTPSIFNRKGEIAGFADWTQHTAKSVEIDKWSNDPRYSISLQSRIIRAFDIDVPDPKTSVKISKFIFDKVGLLPTRLRSNSGKQLLAFELKGDYAKRVMKVEGGIVEFLATGQQFIACGAHFDNNGKPSGARYEWAGGLPDAFPILSDIQFEKLWAAMTAVFALEPPSEGRTRLPKGELVKIFTDPVAKFLADSDRVLSFGKEGQLFVECPFKKDHTGDSGETETAYFPAGGRGYKIGHWKCLHAHCADKVDQDFLLEVGYVANDFDVIAEDQIIDEKGVPTDRGVPGAFKRDKTGAIESTLNNVLLALRRTDFSGIRLRYDSFRDEATVFSDITKVWVPLTDAAQVGLRSSLETKRFKPVGRELMRDSVIKVADEFKFDSAIEWINNLKWDGVCRVTNFMHTYMRSEDTPYARAVSEYMWTALAGRALVPGIKTDMVPIWVGPQSRGKSSAVAALVSSPDFFTEINLQDKDDNLSRLMRGRLVAEIGELRGLHSRDLESNKAFITRTHENWVPKFREFATTFPRRLLFIGTTNQDEFLADETGNRRWLPIRIVQADVPAIQRDHLQLWAEAREMFELMGIAWQDAERLGAAEHEQYMITDSWQDVIERWLVEVPFDQKDAPCDRAYLKTGEILGGALGVLPKQMKRADEARVMRIMKRIGYDIFTISENGSPVRVWVKKPAG